MDGILFNLQGSLLSVNIECLLIVSITQYTTCTQIVIQEPYVPYKVKHQRILAQGVK